MTFATLRNVGIRLAVVAAMTSQMQRGALRGIDVTIDNFTFSPAQLTVKAGTTVTWKNQR